MKPRIGLNFVALTVLSLILLTPAPAQRRWESFPPTPVLPKPERSGTAAVNGVHLWYAVFGHGSPLILVHGGLGNANYWGLQIPALAEHFEVIVLDSRGHGRSTRSSGQITYHLMASDVIGLMDFLHLPKAALAGWSDGAIIGLDIAIYHPERLTKLFAFAANSNPSGVKDLTGNRLFDAYFSRTQEEYRKLSPTADGFKAFNDNLGKMWEKEPHFSDDQLRSIKVPTWIVDGDHDEAIKREDTDHMAALIPDAGELILPEVSHFALLQDPEQFNQALLHFLLCHGEK